MTDQNSRPTPSSDVAALIENAIRFANWAAGEGISPIDEAVAGPEDFLFAYSEATGDEEWDTLAERIAALSRPSPPAQVEVTDAERISNLFGPRINAQVIVASIEAGDYGENPEWLWRNHETGVVGFGRWSKDVGQAPYVRADIAIAAVRAALTATDAKPVRCPQCDLGLGGHEPGCPNAKPVAAIVPEGCTGSSLAFEEGTLHVSKDGSGYITIVEDNFQLEDDRCEGPDGLEGSVYWITRFPPGEMTALRDFLNGVKFEDAKPVVPAEPVAFVSIGQLEAITDRDDDGGTYVPMRKTAKGNFTTPLYTAPPSPAVVTALPGRAFPRSDGKGGWTLDAEMLREISGKISKAGWSAEMEAVEIALLEGEAIIASKGKTDV